MSSGSSRLSNGNHLHNCLILIAVTEMSASYVYFYFLLFLVLEFQTRFWFPKPTPARASVRGLEFDSGLLETKERRLDAAKQPLRPNHHHGRQQRWAKKQHRSIYF